jgi:D-arginine dehydrogenase
MDVHALLQGYLRWLRSNGGRLINRAGVQALQRVDGQWVIHTAVGTFRAKILVNAAGAWVDQVAGLAGARASGIQPLRRTAFMVDAPPALDVTHWPMTVDIGAQFYFKPDTGRLLVSPADETISVPCDAWPDDMDLAIAVDRIEQATTLSITHVQQKWAGLRSFVADRNPVIGYDPLIEDFFWIAALGGSGIQTAPAGGRRSGARIRHLPVPDDLQQRGLDERALLPQHLFV